MKPLQKILLGLFLLAILAMFVFLVIGLRLYEPSVDAIGRVM